jgi:hypothetical protein
MQSSDDRGELSGHKETLMNLTVTPAAHGEFGFAGDIGRLFQAEAFACLMAREPLPRKM